MKNKKQLLTGALALGMLVSVSSVFAASTDVVATTTSPVASTIMHHKKMHTGMKATTTIKKTDESDGKVDMKDLKGKDLEVKDDMKSSSTDMMKKKEIKKAHKAHKTHKMEATTTPAMAH